MPRAVRSGTWPEDDDLDLAEGGPRVRKVRSVRLLPEDDPEYRAAMAEQATAHRRLGEKMDPGATYRASHVVEAAVLRWLGTRERLRSERIIAADVLPAGGRAYQRQWLELDAVADLPGGGLRVHEVKFTTSPNALLRGFRQLRRAARLLRTAWPRVETLVVAVPADEGTFDRDEPRLADVIWLEPSALPLAVPGHAVLTLPLDELRADLDEDGHALLAAATSEAAALVRDRRERRVRRDAGQPPEDAPRAARPAGATLTFGDEVEAETSPFAVLARLQEETGEE